VDGDPHTLVTAKAVTIIRLLRQRKDIKESNEQKERRRKKKREERRRDMGENTRC